MARWLRRRRQGPGDLVVPRIKVLRDSNGVEYASFECPACGDNHGPIVSRPAGSVGPTWGWNGDRERPTFTPSLLVRGTVPLTQAQIDAYNAGAALPTPVPRICHSFVTDGQIRFLTDCTHALAGQTVDLFELES
jgi:hypothetical protein